MELILLPFAALVSLGLWGTLLLVAAFIFFVAMTEFERPGGAVLVAFVALTALWWFGVADAPRWVWSNPWSFAGWSFAYLVVGVLWSGFKWYKFNRVKIDAYEEAKRLYPGFRMVAGVGGALVETAELRTKKEDFISEKLKHTHNFFNWIILWWASMFWYVFSDLLADFVDFVLRRLGFYYDWIQNFIWRDVQ